MNYKRLNRYYYLRLKRLRGDPKILAGGIALGVLIGLTPTMPLHTVLIIALTLLTRTSTIAGIVSSFLICNPLTYFPIYYFSLRVGNMLTPYQISWSSIRSVLGSLVQSEGILHSLKILGSLGYETIVVMVSGGFVIALPFAVISYYVALYLFKNLNAKRLIRTN
ncbi:MAG: DUF2062 domain-containing protein [Deltaproteobacteria bacterium]|nr:DUF2062 domain-containing protein [Deltaproteobacteria bacterium]MBW2659119.1 DUF2062 domain-containing protein [Deltaproteobacteria bacterium]